MDNCTSLLVRSRATSSTVGSNPTPSAHFLEAWQSQADRTVLERRQRATRPLGGSNPSASAQGLRRGGGVRLNAPASKADGSLSAGPRVRIPPSPQIPRAASIRRDARRGCDLGGVAQRQSVSFIRRRPWVRCPPPLPTGARARVDKEARLQSESASYVGSNPTGCSTMILPEWRNGSRAGFRTRCPSGRAGSTPVSGTEYARVVKLAATPA